KISDNTVGAAIAASINATASVNCIVGFSGFSPYYRTTKDPRQPKADPEGWIKHDGSGCPLPLGTKYEALRVGYDDRPFRSTVEYVDIEHGSLWFDIINDVTAYRVLPG
ncbi:MAG: hypothetical protein RLZZ182_2131, partial [Pseudomonadota bacterium]